MENQQKLWFKGKSYGYGWTPSSWEGWIVILIFAAVIVFADAHWMSRVADLNPADASSRLLKFFAVLILDSVALIAVCIKKGEKPRWRWGDAGKKDPQ